MGDTSVAAGGADIPSGIGDPSFMADIPSGTGATSFMGDPCIPSAPGDPRTSAPSFMGDIPSGIGDPRTSGDPSRIDADVCDEPAE